VRIGERAAAGFNDQGREDTNTDTRDGDDRLDAKDGASPTRLARCVRPALVPEGPSTSVRRLIKKVVADPGGIA